ncbi:alpha-xenorhabdolysin family binary toxin subunit B [Pseudomonas oryzicola]|uniref:Alpha-xenorhabdolysin family binary toxin subunit B n=1 Tax=Pseudomonas oryzicola TaxID=485876 RepID=A0ABS6Q7L3_9PSED|nr:alpha-xenorhabdolysin family binary toxin subunit B [Pseudomonas oryzicola]MBV4490171.1 alpha-xenorhabdolysin family binary toxin subunit B [Pseudomonas oryzicola]
MDVTNIDTVTPDFIKMQKAQDEIFQLIDTWDMKVLAGAREQLGLLRTLMLAVERSFNEFLIGAIVLLDDRAFVPRRRDADAHDGLSSVLSRLSQLYKELTKQNQRLELFSLSSFEEALPALQRLATSKQQQAVIFSQRLAELRQQKADILQAIEVFDSPSIATVLKGQIPSEEEIDQIAGLISNPKIDAGLIKLVTQKLAKHADALQGAKTFSDLSAARIRLDAKIEVALADQQQALHMQQVSQMELEAMTALCAIEPRRNEWLAELRKVEQECDAQTSKLSAIMDLEVATGALQELCAYLKSVHMAYDRS